MRPALLLPAALAALAACVPPEVEEALGPEPPGSTYPDLIPQAEILGDDRPDPEAEAEEAAAFEARVEALRRKAREIGALTP